MSPSRTRKSTVRARPRAEVATAVAAAAGIVGATVLVIWLMRPGTPGVPGGGGLLSRQPRATLLGVLTAAALALGIWWVLNGRRRPRRLQPRTAVGLTAAVVLAGAVVAAVLWPSGVVRHYPGTPSQSPLSPIPTPSTVTSKSSTAGTTPKTATPTATATTTGK